MLPGEGIGDNGTWPAEQSVLVLGIELEHAVQLGRRFGQRAIVYGRVGGRAALACTRRGKTRGVDTVTALREISYSFAELSYSSAPSFTRWYTLTANISASYSTEAFAAPVHAPDFKSGVRL